MNEAMSEPVLSFDKVSVRYGKRRVVEDVSLQVTRGSVFALLGRVPARGELIRHPAGLEFEVLDADPRRVKKLRIHSPRPAPQDGTAPAKT